MFLRLIIYKSYRSHSTNVALNKDPFIFSIYLLVYFEYCTEYHLTLMLNPPSGRVSVTTITKKQRKEQKKMDRRNKANQLRRNKKDMVLFFFISHEEGFYLHPWLVLQSVHFFCPFLDPDRETASRQQGRSSSFSCCSIPPCWG